MEQRCPTNNIILTTWKAKMTMTKTSITLQDLRREIYNKAKADKVWRFWGIYVHVYKMETLKESYKIAKSNKGAPGNDGVTFEMIEAMGVDQFLENIQAELKTKTYFPEKKRVKAIPKEGNKMRMLSIPNIKDRVVEGALKLILEPIFEADFQPGSYGYRPKKTAAEAIEKVTVAAIKQKTRVIDVDLSSYFQTIAHAELFAKIAKRVNDRDIMRLLKLIVKTDGKRGIAQGGPISPLLSNIYLNEVDIMLEKAKQVTKTDNKYEHLEYVRWADDLIILIDGHPKWQWLESKITLRLKEELLKIKVELNQEKTKTVDLKEGESFSFLGFDFKQAKTKQGKIGVIKTPRMKARTKLLTKLKEIFRRHVSQPIDRVTYLISPILRGWTNYFRIGNSSRCFGYIKDWVNKKVRRHLMKAKKRHGFGWERWSTKELYNKLGLFDDYQIRYYNPLKA